VLPEYPGISAKERMKCDGTLQTEREPGLVQMIDNGRVFSVVHKAPFRCVLI
jgi:hypothetical protein